MEVLATVIALVAALLVVVWLYGSSRAKGAREKERRKTLQEGAESRDAMDEALSKPVPLGDDMRDGWRRLRDGERD